VSKFEQYLSSKKKPDVKVVLEHAHRSRVDSRVAMYQAFADDERADEARTERSPLVQWARRSASDRSSVPRAPVKRPVRMD